MFQTCAAELKCTLLFLQLVDRSKGLKIEILITIPLFEENKMSQNYFHDLVGNRYLMVKTQFTLMTTTI